MHLVKRTSRLKKVGLGILVVLAVVLYQSNKDRLALAISMTQAQSNKLVRDFKKAQKNQLSALSHRNKMSLKEMKISQSARKKEWEQKEKEARHLFFKEHQTGPERRQYIKDFLERRQVMVNVHKEELAQLKRENEVRRKTLIDAQKSNLADFMEALKRGETPSQSLWPAPGQ